MESCWCYGTEFEFRSLIAWGNKLPLSLSVFAIMLLKRLPDGSKMKRWLPGWFESLMTCFCQRLRQMSSREGRADPEMRSAKCTTLCRALQSWLELFPYHTEMQWVWESIHFLWPLNRKFSGLLVRPWISSAVADGTAFAFLMELEVNWPSFTTWCLPVRKSLIQSQSEEFRPRSVSLKASLMGTIVLKTGL